MTHEEITVLAGHRIVSPWVMKLAMDVAAAEREQCAKVAFEYGWRKCDFQDKQVAACEITDAIRARGEA